MATKPTKTEKSTSLESLNPQSLFPMDISSFKDIDRMFDEYLNRNWFRSLRPGSSRMEDLWGTYEMHSPNMDVIDREKEIVVQVEVPGVEKKDLDISVTDNVLTVKGKSSFESKTEKDDYYKSEIKKGSFSRSISLPANVDSSRIKANMKNGLLELSLPKTGASKKKTIKVS